MARAFEAGVHIRRILFATDFSRAAQAALPHALQLAKHCEAEFFIAHIIQPRPWEIRREISVQRRIDATSRLDETLALPAFRGIHPRPIVRYGAVVEQLVHIAEDYAADLVVTGTRWTDGPRHWLRGSAAEQLAQCAPCPVLTIGPGARPPSQPGFRTIVLATEINRGAAAGIAYAGSFASQQGAKLWVAHALRPRDPELSSDAAETWLKNLVPEQPGVGRVLEVGSLEQIAASLAARESADLVMLAPGVGRLLPQIVRRVTCPVMTVRYAIPMIRPKNFGTRPAISN